MGTKGWLRRSAVALVGALAMAAVATAGPSAPEASAAPYKSKLCWTYVEDGQLKVHCVDIQVKFPWEEIFECWMCGVAFDWTHDPVIREDIQGLVERHIVTGMGYLGDAQYATSSKVRDQLRAQAMNQFGAATRYAGDSRTRLGTPELVDIEHNRADPSPDPWLVAAGTDIADGVALLQQAAANPTAAPRLRALAAAQFDEAYQELAEQKVIG